MDGGRGYDFEKFRATFGDVAKRLIVQDLPKVIENVQNLDACIERMANDFTAAQPVHGARAYFLHSVLHDWSDAMLTLQHWSKAMRKGYSKILVHEIVLPDEDADPCMTALDWIMLATLSSRERTEAQWRELAANSELEVAGIWSHPDGSDRLIELV